MIVELLQYASDNILDIELTDVTQQIAELRASKSTGQKYIQFGARQVNIDDRIKVLGIYKGQIRAEIARRKPNAQMG